MLNLNASQVANYAADFFAFTAGMMSAFATFYTIRAWLRASKVRRQMRRPGQTLLNPSHTVERDPQVIILKEGPLQLETVGSGSPTFTVKIERSKTATKGLRIAYG